MANATSWTSMLETRLISVKYDWTATRNGDKYIQFLAIQSSNKDSIIGGKVNFQDSHITQLADKKVISVRGWLDFSGRIQNLGLTWVSSSFGN